MMCFFVSKDQSKINIQLDKLTSTSVLIRWNNVTLSTAPGAKPANCFYKLEYWLTKNPNGIVKYDYLNSTELHLQDLHPNSDYVVQIVAFQQPSSGSAVDGSQLTTSELALKSFQTLVSDIDAPANLQVVRYEADKLNVKWDPVIMVDPMSSKHKAPLGLIKGYRVYYKELASGHSSSFNDEYDDSSSAADFGGGSDEDGWTSYEQLGDHNVELNIEDLNVNRDYAVKVVAIDHANREGPESKTVVANRLDSTDISSGSYYSNGGGHKNGANSDMYSDAVVSGGGQHHQMPSFPAHSSSSSMYQINERLGMIRDLEVLEYTSTLVKFSWMPPPASPEFKIKFFRISYVDRVKYYKESNGSIVSYHNGIQMSVLVPALEDPSVKITWLLTSLSPNTAYDFNISAVKPDSQMLTHGPPVHKTLITRPDRPAKVDRPSVMPGGIFSDNTVMIKTANASEKNGPISKYWLVVTPLPSCEPSCGSSPQHQSGQMAYDTREKDMNKLLRYSLFNSTHPQLYANESSYITAEFEAALWPDRFMLGDGHLYGRFLNRHLIRGIDYRAYIVAFTEDSYHRQQWARKQNNHHNQQQPPSSNKKNMLDLKDILTASKSGETGDVSQPAYLMENDLSTASLYSEPFNTRQAENAASNQNRVSAINGVAIMDYHNVLWIAGIIASFIFIVILIIIVSLHLMNKKTKTNSANALVLNGRGATVVSGTVGSSTANSSTTMNTTTNLLLGNRGGQIETVASINKMGTITTNTIKASVNRLNSNMVNGAGGSAGNVGQTTTNTTSSSASSASSASSTTASPTAALLSCSVNNNSSSGGGGGGGNSQPTEGMANLVNPNGLLTTASPLHHFNHNQQQVMADSLYTSIDVTQRLLQQQMNGNLMMENAAANLQSVQNSQMMMMMLMNNNGGGGGNTSTLSRSHQHQQMMNSFGTSSLTLSQHHHYDPIEFRRINYQTPQLLAHPPIHVDELTPHIERLKAHNNAKFTIEYESIEVGQQFQWESSVMEVNRQKNRYANVVAYDHSRVVLSKLPPQAFSTPATLNNSMSPIHQQYYNHYGTLGHDGSMGGHSYNTGTLPHHHHNSSGMNSNTGTLQHHHHSNGHHHQNQYRHHNGGGLIDTSSPSTLPLPPPPPPPPGTAAATIQSSPAALSNCSDYINANFLDGYRKRNCYIATQGPLPSTYGDFWRMIWEQQTYTIAMMTKLEERNRLKCDQYWPSKGTEIYGNVMQVTLVDYTELASYSVRTFVISPVNTYAQMQIIANSNNINFEMRREVKQFQYTAWPDHGVPDNPTPFLMFLRRIRQVNPSDSGPIVIHCSAGVGRTGCYIAIDTMLERLKHEKTVDLYGMVTCMRAQRNFMVQTEDQYIFCYDSVAEAAQSGITEVSVNALYQHLQRLLQLAPEDPSSMLTEMELEYKRLSNIKAPQSKFQSANLAANKFKNRLVNILPYESTRVCLQPLPNASDSSGTDYINANFIDGYKYKRAYIATQAPLQETVDDFWRMLWEHNSSIVVMLTKLREMGREKCVQYWPSERSMRYQYFLVEPVAEYNMSQYVLREFKVTDARDGQSRTIRQFQFIDWPEQGVPKSGEGVIELIGQVHKTKEQFGQTGPITVHCSAGVGRTGVFITLSIVLERMRYEGMIDVFNTVKVLRAQRPAMVQTEDQYQFCYRAALEYLGSFE